MNKFFKNSAAKAKLDALVLKDGPEHAEHMVREGKSLAAKDVIRKHLPGSWDELARMMPKRIQQQKSGKGGSQVKSVTGLARTKKGGTDAELIDVGKSKISRSEVLKENRSAPIILPSIAQTSTSTDRKSKPVLNIAEDFPQIHSKDIGTSKKSVMSDTNVVAREGKVWDEEMIPNARTRTISSDPNVGLKTTQFRPESMVKVNLISMLDEVERGEPLNMQMKKGKLELVKASDDKMLMTNYDLSKEIQVPEFAEDDFYQSEAPKYILNFPSMPLKLKTAKELKELILGNSSLMFNDSWKYQGFPFSDHNKLQYGIVQDKNGPCGVLSAVQAFILRHLLFTENSQNQSLEPTPTERTAALVSALATVLWQAGQQKKAVVAVLGKTSYLKPAYFRADGVTEKVLTVTLESYEDLLHCLSKLIDQFKSAAGPGVVLSLYSAVLSRTIQGVHSDMDNPKSSLIDGLGYCSQELVNLFLTGSAVTNIFNGDVEAEKSIDLPSIMKGIRTRSEIGLLVLSEYHKSSKGAGTFLKTPKYPIWLLRIGKHFSVLFAPNRDILSDWKAEKKFQLHYYDGLSRRNEELTVTIDNTRASFNPAEEEEVSSIELCIRTKWSQAEIIWNGIRPRDLA